MRRIALFVLLSFTAAKSHGETRNKYPPARTEGVEDVYFNTKVPDPYRWLEDSHSSEVQAWVKAENDLARDFLGKLPGREALLQRIKALTYVGSVSLPEKRGKRIFYWRHSKDTEMPLLYWREGSGGKEHLLLDPNQWDPAQHAVVGQWFPSPDGKHLAYAVKKNNGDKGLLRVLDISTRLENPKEAIEWQEYADLAWAPDGKGFYYTRISTDPSIPETERVAFADVAYHVLGSELKSDPPIFPKTGDPTLYLTPIASRDGRWLFILISNGWTSSGIYVKDNLAKNPRFDLLFVSTCATAAIAAWKGHFFLTTNKDAPHYQILRSSAHTGGDIAWTPIVPERPDTTIDSAHVIGDRLVLIVNQKAASRMEVRALDGSLIQNVPLPSLGSVSGVNGEEDDDEAYYQFDSFSIPPRVYKMSVSHGEPALWAKADVPVDPSPFLIEQATYPSKDGTAISMFIVRRKGLRRDGSTRFFLEGYGGLNVAILPRFNSGIYPLLEAGWGYAIPNLRGGGEYGESWHKAGMLLNKQNTFDDFISAAEFLINKGYTKKENLAIQGTSNGGLLAGAALVQRPDLFRAVICKVPLLDMIRYPLFGEGKTWVPEYGSAENEEQFHALFSYSPYHHVKPGSAYPGVLLISADSDDRVDPMHARKMAAALQASQASENPILLLTLPHSGHGGSGLKRSRVEELADRSAFLIHELGR